MRESVGGTHSSGRFKGGSAAAAAPSDTEPHQ